MGEIHYSSAHKQFLADMSIVSKFDEYDHNYLEPTLRKTRLFKEGNIHMPFKFYYFRENSNSFSGGKWGSITYDFSREIFKIEDSEIEELKSFLNNFGIPFKKNFLELAFENYELSYQINNINLQFLTLMNGLEALFHPSNEGELTYRISRNVAVLLGENENKALDIQKEMKDLYRKRSKIVHTGKSDVSNEDLLKLRHYARESIKEIYKINKSKDEILKLLNLNGFGQRSWI